MAFSRRAFCSEQHTKSLSDVSGIETPGSCGMIVSGALDQADHQIIHRSQNSSGSANRHAGSIFAKSDTPNRAGEPDPDGYSRSQPKC